MQHDPTTTTQEQLLFEEDQLAHEYGILLARAEGAQEREQDVDDVVYPYAYALESVVT